MKKAKIYIPTKTAMQSGRGKQKKWLLEFETRDAKAGPLMGWDASDDTLNQVKLEFNSKENAIEYAKSNNIEYKLSNWDFVDLNVTEQQVSSVLF